MFKVSLGLVAFLTAAIGAGIIALFVQNKPGTWAGVWFIIVFVGMVVAAWIYQKKNP